jgi:hypothetical protein
MKDYDIDTSQDYEDLVSFMSDKNMTKISTGLGEFIDEDISDYKPSVVNNKQVDPDFPEDWQTLIVSFETKEDIPLFTKLSGIIISPKKSDIVYECDGDSVGILDFLGDD